MERICSLLESDFDKMYTWIGAMATGEAQIMEKLSVIAQHNVICFHARSSVSQSDSSILNMPSL